MKRLALLSLLFVAACNQLPTETASRAPFPPRADGGMTLGGGQYTPSQPRAEGGMTMGGGLYTPPPCTDENGQPVSCT
jgi:hypothetical protein